MLLNRSRVKELCVRTVRLPELATRGVAPVAVGGRIFRRHSSWCWGLEPHIRPDSPEGVVYRVVVASSAYVNGCCLRAAIDGMSGKVLARQWCNREKPLPTRLCSYGGRANRCVRVRRDEDHPQSVRRILTAHPCPTLPDPRARGGASAPT